MKFKLKSRLCLLLPVVLMTPVLFTSCSNMNKYNVTIDRSNNNPLSDSNTSVTLTATIFDVRNQVDISDRENVTWICSEQVLPAYLKSDINHNTITLILETDRIIREQKLIFTAKYGEVSRFVEVMISSYTPPNYSHKISLDKNLVLLTQPSKVSIVTATITPSSTNNVTFNSDDLANLPNYITTVISGNELTLSLVDNKDTIQGNFPIRVSFTDAATKTIIVETENYESWVNCIPKDYLNINGSVLNGIKSGISISQLDPFTTLKIPREITKVNDWAFAWDASYGSFQSYLSSNNVNLDWGESKISLIGKYAFTIAPFKGALVLPSTITTLSEGCFGSLGWITSLDMLNATNVKSIPKDCFTGCSAISSIKFTNSITTISNSAFMGCYKLAGVISLPSELTTIQAAAFTHSGRDGTGCTIAWNSKIKTISDSCFAASNLTGELTIPNAITSLPQSVFNRTKITKVTIGSSITSIGAIAFADCHQLKEFVISNTRHFPYSANPSNPASQLTLLYGTPIDPNGSSPSDSDAKVIVPASELSWYQANWPSRLTIEAAP